MMMHTNHPILAQCIQFRFTSAHPTFVHFPFSYYDYYFFYPNLNIYPKIPSILIKLSKVKKERY